MAWIESHQELGQHPKTKRLARRLGISLPAAVGHLHYLWWWALSYAQDGDLTKYEPEDIADAVMWDGDPDELINALVGVGFLDNHDGLFIHDWDDYAGRLIAKRQANAERARNWRTQKHTERITNAYATHNEQATNTATVPNRTVPNQTMEDQEGGVRAREEQPPTPKTKQTPQKTNYAEHVTMTEAEYAKLVDKYSEEAVTWMIAKLDAFKGSKGKNYKSDYKAILSWVVEAWEERQRKVASGDRARVDPSDDLSAWEEIARQQQQRKEATGNG